MLRRLYIKVNVSALVMYMYLDYIASEKILRENARFPATALC